MIFWKFSGTDGLEDELEDELEDPDFLDFLLFLEGIVIYVCIIPKKRKYNRIQVVWYMYV